jgi:hypothetical protein
MLIALFEREEDLLDAVRAARDRRFAIKDVHTPYAVHGLDKALGYRPSRLSWACFALGLSGAAFMTWFQLWTSAVSWPINVGGKPWNSLPAYVPVIFEGMVLCGGVGTVIVFLIVSGLFPWREPRLPDPAVTDNRFALVMEQTDAAFDFPAVRRMFEQLGAVEVRERLEEAR